MQPYLEKLKKALKKMPSVKLGYLFGSRANNQSGPTSDYDFAFYIDEKDAVKRFDVKTLLQERITKLLRTDKVDVVILNDVKSPELKYNIIKDSVLFYEKEPFKVLIEPRVMNEYFDFHSSLVKYGLTKA